MKLRGPRSVGVLVLRSSAPGVSGEPLMYAEKERGSPDVFHPDVGWPRPLLLPVSVSHFSTCDTQRWKQYSLSVKVLHYSKVLLSKKSANKNHRKYFLKTYFKNKQLKQMPFLWLYITFSLRISFLVISLKNYKKKHSVIVCLLFVLICS